ncbi:MAG: CRISPR-associated protein Cas4 [Lachnospiraceae bacterium]|nr:CRISPR-associated protein Cas4 [Lachnospiraceae bacterium]
MDYKEEDYLQLSGLQHFLFCRRQWALIHIENQWAENFKTVDGELMHKNAHDAEYRSKRGDQITVRAMKIHSSKLGLSGECDVVEFKRDDDNGVPLANEIGKWSPYPVEYKRGAAKTGIEDEAQLCAQAMCLEEMLCCDIPEGALFYGSTRHRKDVEFSRELREQVVQAVKEMHMMFRRGTTPKARMQKGCSACSLMELCIPVLSESKSVEAYMRRFLRGDC